MADSQAESARTKPPTLTLDALRAEIDAGTIDTVVVAFTDMQGRLTGKRLHGRFFLDHVLEAGTEGCNYLLAVDVDMNTVSGYAMSSWERGYGDFFFDQDLSTLRRTPGQPNSATIQCDLSWLDGSGPVKQSPRSILKSQVEAAAHLSFSAYAGTELEFIVFEDSFDAAWDRRYQGLTGANRYNVDYSIAGGTRVEPLLRDIRNQMYAAGVVVEGAKGECNLGQHEIAFLYDDVVRTCDNHVIYKTAAKEIAAAHGQSLTFMAKYDEREGNSCHIHLSLRGTDGSLAFSDEERQHGHSAVFDQFLAGLLATMREFSYFYAPNINSYKRFQPGTFAPTAIAWGHDNRTCALRVVGHGAGLRVENRVPGGDVNPYLAVAAMLAGGLYGIRNSLELEPELVGNAYTADVEHIPATLAEARALLAGSTIARDAFGDEVVDHYVNAADVELRAFNAAVTDWERVRGVRAAVTDTLLHEVVNPATEETVQTVELANREATDEAIARAAAVGPAWQAVAPADRGRLLRRFADLVGEHNEELAQLEVVNAGHTIGNARWEAGNVRDVLTFYSAAPERLHGKQIPVAGGLDVTFKEPLGVVGIIVPWNFPMPIAGWGFAPALAAGNTVVLKPAELTPLTAMRLGELALEAGLPRGVFTVLPGPGSVVGERFVTHPDVRKICFTGSTAVGQGIMRKAADQLKRVTLELGGKSANLIFADSDLEAAAAAAPMSFLDNAGQDCCARSRILVERTVFDRFLSLFEHAIKAVSVGNPGDEATQMGPLISAAQRQTVRSFVEDAEGSVDVAFRGSAPDGAGWWYAPTVVLPGSTDDRIWQEEVFGPVVAVLPFDDEDDAVVKANDTAYGLSGSIWTSNVGKAIRVARGVEAGNLSVNSHSSVRYSTPFGGFKASGLGRELGPDALDAFTEVKNVFIDTTH